MQNTIGRFHSIFLLLSVGFLASFPSVAGVNVLTQRYDSARSGENPLETVLNTSNVNPAQFGKLWTYSVDASIYAQPLIMTNVRIANGTIHDVVYVATMNDSVYAFDANSNQGTNSAPLWQVSFVNPAAGITPIPANNVQYVSDITGNIGIESTPVIDQQSGTMYVVAHTMENGAYVQRLHALDVGTGQERPGSPVQIQATVTGTSYEGVNGQVPYNVQFENQRASLALQRIGSGNPIVYVASGSHNDINPWHGWVLAYDGVTMAQLAVFNSSPDGGEAGIWQAGTAPAIDAQGNVYAMTGNAPTWDGTRNFPESILKLNPQTLTVQDYFTVDTWLSLSQNDVDLGSSGVLLLPGTSYVLGGGKSGVFYLVNTANMGHLQTGNGQIVQSWQCCNGHIHGTPTYWSGYVWGPTVYVWSEYDKLKAFQFNGSTFNTTPVMTSSFADPNGMPGGFLTISANWNASGSGILWANVPYSGDANHAVVPGVVRAFDASNLNTELWDSQMNAARDSFGNFAKFVPPVVANGKLYMATFSNSLAVYGLLPVDFSLSVSPASQTVLQGAGTSYTATVSGGSQPIALSVTGLPAGATATFSPQSLTGPGTSTLAVSTTSSTPGGTYSLTLTATSPTFTHSQAVTLVVTVPSAGFTLSETPANFVTAIGNGAGFSVTTVAQNGFTGAVSFSVAGLPAGATSSFTPAKVTGSGTTSLGIATVSGTVAGTYPLTITATSGSTSQTVTANLILQPSGTGVTNNYAGYFTLDGISYDSNPGDGNFDTSGTSYSANQLASPLTLGGVNYLVGPFTDGMLNIIGTNGQTLPLVQGRYTSLNLAAASVFNNYGGNYVVHYRDGSSLTYHVNMTDWARPAANGEATISTMAYGNSPTGRTGFAVRVFQYIIPTDRTKAVVSVTLPNGAHTRVLGITGVL